MISALWQGDTRASRKSPPIALQGSSWQRHVAPQHPSSGAVLGGLNAEKKLRHNQTLQHCTSLSLVCVCVLASLLDIPLLLQLELIFLQWIHAPTCT